VFPESAFMSMAYVAFLDTCTNDQFQAMSIVRDVMHMSAAVDLRYMVFAKLQVGRPPALQKDTRRCAVHPHAYEALSVQEWEHNQQHKNMLGGGSGGLDMSRCTHSSHALSCLTATHFAVRVIEFKKKYNEAITYHINVRWQGGGGSPTHVCSPP